MHSLLEDCDSPAASEKFSSVNAPCGLNSDAGEEAVCAEIIQEKHLLYLKYTVAPSPPSARYYKPTDESARKADQI